MENVNVKVTLEQENASSSSEAVPCLNTQISAQVIYWEALHPLHSRDISKALFGTQWHAHSQSIGQKKSLYKGICI